MPDVSGIDRVFDYSVPDRLRDAVRPGVRVRVPLNGRRVSGWVVRVAEDTDIESARLVDIVSVSGQSVEEDIVPLTRWVADEFWGPWRAVLASAAAPRVRRRGAVPSRTGVPGGHVEPDAKVLRPVLGDGGGLVVVPPLDSVVSLLAEAARTGPVLAVCPTIRMARLGAAALRRHGLTTAEVPDEWERAAAGVDVVIGARTAVFAPCPGLSCIMVVDEHDESLQEERSPTWHARTVAAERARLAGIPVVLTSPVPSAEAVHALGDRMVQVAAGVSWPSMEVEDLEGLPVAGSILGARMLAAVNAPDGVTLCILNTKGNARLLRCGACHTLQACQECASALRDDGSGALHCARCGQEHGSVCVKCGRTGFKVIAGGTTTLANDLRRSTGREVVELTAETDSWETGRVFVGTDAVLHRVPRADTVVFCDADRDMLSPHLSAGREFLARLVRAARLVGARGSIVVQTRMTGHPLMAALRTDDVQARLSEFLAADVTLRKSLGLPPFSRVVRVAGAADVDPADVAGPGVQVISVDGDLIVRGARGEDIAGCLAEVRERASGPVRIYADPLRF